MVLESSAASNTLLLHSEGFARTRPGQEVPDKTTRFEAGNCMILLVVAERFRSFLLSAFCSTTRRFI